MTIAPRLACCSVSLCLLAFSASWASGQSLAPTASASEPAAVSANSASTSPSAVPAQVAPLQLDKHGSSVFADLFTPLASDFRQLGAKRNLLLMGIGVGAAATSHTWDQQTARSKWGTSVDDVFEPGQLVGAFMTQAGAAVGVYAIGRATGHDRLATIGSHLFRAQIVSQTTTQALKLATTRTRPDGTRLSFPSGHSAAAFATASVLQADLGWKAGLPAYAVATWVAASRVQTKRHYVSDVVAGAAVGILAGRSVTIGHGSARFALSPTVVPGGIGITALKLEDR